MLKGWSRGVWVALFVALAIRVFFAAVTPLRYDEKLFNITSFNDELAHFNYVKKLAIEKRVPVQVHNVQQPEAWIEYDFNYFHPPLSYVLSAPVWAAVDRLFPGGGHFAVRGLSILWGFSFLVVAGRIAVRLLGPDALVPTLVFTALLGSHVRFSSLVSNDSLAWLLAAIFLYLLIKLGDTLSSGSPVTRRQHLILWLVGAAACLTQATLLPLMVLVFIPYGLAWWRNRQWQSLVVPLAIVSGAYLVVSPWYLRNFLLYGSITGMETGAGPPGRWLIDPTPERVYYFLNSILHTFWFPFDVALYGRFQQILFVFLAGITAAVVSTLIYRAVRKRRSLGDLGAVLILVSATALSCAGLIYFNLWYRQSDARYAFGALAPVVCGVVYIAQLLPKRWVIFSLVVATLIPYLLLLWPSWSPLTPWG